MKTATDFTFPDEGNDRTPFATSDARWPAYSRSVLRMGWLAQFLLLYLLDIHSYIIQ